MRKKLIDEATLILDYSFDTGAIAISVAGGIIIELWKRQIGLPKTCISHHFRTAMKQASLECKDLGKIIIANGPGLFSGIRSTFSFGLGLAYGISGAKVYLINSLVGMISFDFEGKFLCIGRASKYKYYLLKGEISKSKIDITESNELFELKDLDAIIQKEASTLDKIFVYDDTWSQLSLHKTILFGYEDKLEIKKQPDIQTICRFVSNSVALDIFSAAAMGCNYPCYSK